ncbi:hypothetical protein [Chryseobacterium wangxinyae]|uniref:hypothetical protein n=1 Tax=Chryseobacterium sp. CY353 TaxID=2997334 RepID=UPI00226E454A|nr:hypothetical protein [Chryseobacterium sp. CY353]MCY0969531.1 hypothetical protein [Chryseobacterium sp. CY353]
MKTFLIILIFSFLMSCTIKQKPVSYYLSSGIEDIKIFPVNKEDSAKINNINIASDKSLAECQKLKNAKCSDDRGNRYLDATFPKGIYNFRILLFDNFKLPKNAKEGESRIRITIGTHDNIERIEILKYTDENTKKAIEDVFRLKELNVWTSAKIYGIPVNEQFEISVFVKKKL